MGKNKSFDTGKSKSMERNEQAAQAKAARLGRGRSSVTIQRSAGSGGNRSQRSERRQG